MKTNANETLTSVNDGIKLIQNPSGLTFGTDALLLAAFMRTHPRSNGAEIGCGTGIVSLLAAGRKKLGHITALEIQSEYADIASRNIELNGLSDKIRAVCADAREYAPEKELDAVFCNPPYMKMSSGKRNVDDGKYAARHEVNGDIFDLCAAASRLLKFGGLFYCVYRPDRLAELFAALRNATLEPKLATFVLPDADHPPCLALLECKKGAAPAMTVSKPLILCERGSTTASPDAAYIYENGEFPDGYRKK